MAACERCSGTGFEIVEKEGRDFAQPCACRAAARSTPDFVSGARIPARYEACSLENFDGWTPSHEAARERAMSYCSGSFHICYFHHFSCNKRSSKSRCQRILILVQPICLDGWNNII